MENKETLTKFREAISTALFLETSNKELSVERVTDLAEILAPKLLGIARKEIEEEVDIESMLAKFHGDFWKMGAYRQGLVDMFLYLKRVERFENEKNTKVTTDAGWNH